MSTTSAHAMLRFPRQAVIDQFAGESSFIPKASIKGLKVVMPARLQALHLPVADAAAFDPYKVLGLAKGASWEEIRAAYLGLRGNRMLVELAATQGIS